jgi:hypothetical protein
MITINYPSKHFLRTSFQLLREGNDLAICVRPGWRSKMVEKEFEYLPSCVSEAYNAQASGKKPPSLKMSIMMMPIITVHNFALSGEYIMRLSREGGIHVLYSRHIKSDKGPE